MTWVKIFVVTYLLGVVAFTTAGEYYDPTWVKCWAMWQRVCHGSVLAWICLYKTLKGEEKIMVRPVMKYSIIFVLWEITALFTGLSVNDNRAVDIIFGLTAGFILYLSLYRHRNISRFITKYLHL